MTLGVTKNKKTKKIYLNKVIKNKIYNVWYKMMY